jgi:MinD superfamily P-loop ATPase
MIEMPVIDTEKCSGCGLCVEVCQQNVLILIGDIVTVNTAGNCDWCTDCEIVCMEGALTCPFEIVIN